MKKSKNHERGGSMARLSPVHAFLAAAILGLLVMPLAFAGAKDSATSAKVTNAKFKKLKQRVGALEGRGSEPSGPAGGDLTGTYPNPRIGPNAVSSAEVAADSLTGADLALDTLAAGDIAPDAIGASELAADSAGASEVALDAVGSSELKGANAAVSGGVDPGAGYQTQTANCDAGEAVIGGGFAWDTDTAATIVSSTPGSLGNPTSWSVRGGATAAGNTLFAWALCLDV